MRMPVTNRLSLGFAVAVLRGARLRDCRVIRVAADRAAVSAGVQHSRASSSRHLRCTLTGARSGCAGAGQAWRVRPPPSDWLAYRRNGGEPSTSSAGSLGVVAVTVLLGQHVALPLFIALYLMVWGKYRWPLALGYAAAGLVLLVVLFDYISPTTWYPAILLQ